MNKETIGNYTLYKNHRNKLGKGSFSSVYKGQYNGPTNKHLANNDNVAIKIINTYGLNHKDLEIINNETRIMNMLKENNHPHIIKCVDTLQTSKCTYIMMELCDAGDLAVIMIKPIKEDYVKMYFIQLINGLKFLHLHNFIHRDIKPKNILLTNGGKTLKIADFGFAKIVNEQLIKEKMCGSPLYMAPEIMNNDVYNDQSDLWSVGLILYEMIYGTHPYENCKTLEELQKIINSTVIQIPPETIENINASAECVELLRKLLQKNISARISWDAFFDNAWIKINNNHINENFNIDDMHVGGMDEHINIIPPINRTISKHISIHNKTKDIEIPRRNSVRSFNSFNSYDSPENITKLVNSQINIIENYCYTNNSPNIKINNYVTDSCIFEMDFGDECQMKKVIL